MTVDFIDYCKNELNRMKCSKVNFYSDDYYSMECIQFLPEIIEKIDTFDELLITPYYFINDEIVELYEYKLSIKIVTAKNSKELFFLEETGKKSLDDIPKQILELLDFTYYEVLMNDKVTFINSLKRYTTYISDNKTEIMNKVRFENGGHGEIFYEIL